jgi:hypothetical protein
VNLDAGLLAVRQIAVSVSYEVLVDEPKSAYGERTVALDQVTVDVLRAVRRHQLVAAKALGSAWTDTGLVFTRPRRHRLAPRDGLPALRHAAQGGGTTGDLAP